MYDDDFSPDEYLGRFGQLFGSEKLLADPGLAAVRDEWTNDATRRLWRLNTALLFAYCRSAGRGLEFSTRCGPRCL